MDQAMQQFLQPQLRNANGTECFAQVWLHSPYLHEQIHAHAATAMTALPEGGTHKRGWDPDTTISPKSRTWGEFRYPSLRKWCRNLLVQQSPRHICVFNSKVLEVLGNAQIHPSLALDPAEGLLWSGEELESHSTPSQSWESLVQSMRFGNV